MSDHDVVTELADRVQDPDGLEFEIEWHALTDEEREEFEALMDQRVAAGGEKLEALEENNRILALLLAYDQRTITAMEFVERVRCAVPDPLAD
jgi:hypothetical protein